MYADEPLVPRLREARIDLDAVRDNVASLGELTVDVSLDAYGHGAVAVARYAEAEGARHFLVRDELEWATLREAGYDAVIGDSVPDGSAYGIGDRAHAMGLVPAMRVSARVVSLKIVDTGDGVSYGHTWRAPAPTKLALVPLGYADGLSRAAGNVASLWLGNALRPIVGRVAMNVCVVDVGGAVVDVGDEAVLFGGTFGPSVDDWAESLGIPALEATSALGSHIPRSPA